MQISRENFFKKQYISVLENNIKTKGTSRIFNLIKKHKIITISFLIFITCLILNLTLIYNFMKILSNMY